MGGECYIKVKATHTLRERHSFPLYYNTKGWAPAALAARCTDSIQRGKRGFTMVTQSPPRRSSCTLLAVLAGTRSFHRCASLMHLHLRDAHTLHGTHQRKRGKRKGSQFQKARTYRHVDLTTLGALARHPENSDGGTLWHDFDKLLTMTMT